MSLNSDLAALITVAEQVIALNLPTAHAAIDSTVQSLTTRLNDLIPTPTPPVPASPPPVPTPVGQPSDTNTGVPAGAALLPASATTLTTGTYTNLSFVDQVTITGDVVINASKLNANGENYCVNVVSGSVVLNNCELVGASQAGTQGNSITLNQCYIHAMGSDATKAANNFVMNGCYITQIGLTTGSHADGCQAENGTGISITNTFFDLKSSGFSANSCIFLNGTLFGATGLSGTIIKGNWFSGGNYELYLLNQVGTVVENNVFDLAAAQYGACDGKGSAAIWSGNTDLEGNAL